MKTAVVYYSQTGNTRKVAEAIAAALPENAFCEPLTDGPDLTGCDLVFVGMPVEQFGPPAAARAFIEEHCAGRRLALFVTHAAPEEAPPLREWLENCRAAASGAEVVGLFNCQGQLDPVVKNHMLNSGNPTLVKWAEGDTTSQGKPDAPRLERAQAFARDVAASLGA